VKLLLEQGGELLLEQGGSLLLEQAEHVGAVIFEAPEITGLGNVAAPVIEEQTGGDGEIVRVHRRPRLIPVKIVGDANVTFETQVQGQGVVGLPKISGICAISIAEAEVSGNGLITLPQIVGIGSTTFAAPKISGQGQIETELEIQIRREDEILEAWLLMHEDAA